MPDRKFFPMPFAFILLTCIPASAKVVQTLESFSNEYEWINTMRCKRPTAKAPPRVWIDTPLALKTKDKKISIRRWADRNGDGTCELYDVEGMEKEDYPGKLDDYPMRTTKYENGVWRVPQHWSDVWVPLILLDKVTGERLEIPYKLGLSSSGKGGPTRGGNGFEGQCESMRVNLAIGYMLLFHFPTFAKNDPVMSPNGAWNDYGGGWMRSEFWNMKDENLNSLPDDCLEKYRLVIDALKKERGF